MVDFVERDTTFNSQFNWKIDENGVHARFSGYDTYYGRNWTVVHSGKPGSLAAQNIAIHADNMMRLEAIQKQFASKEYKCLTLACLVGLALFMPPDWSYTYAGLEGGLATVCILSVVLRLRYRSKREAISGLQSELIHQLRRNLHYGNPIYQGFDVEGLNHAERQEVVSAVHTLPDRLLQEGIVCADGGQSCIHKPTCAPLG